MKVFTANFTMNYYLPRNTMRAIFTVLNQLKIFTAKFAMRHCTKNEVVR